MRNFSLMKFVSLGLLFSFVVMGLSGIILYIAPEGSFSRWIGWDILGLDKKAWEAQHTIFSYLFVIFSVLHIFKINWQPILTYFTPANIKNKISWEFVLSFIFVLIIFVGISIKSTPFIWVYEKGNFFSDTWGKNYSELPVQDAEKLTMSEFIMEVSAYPMTEIITYLKAQGIIVEDMNALVGEIASKNNIAPVELYSFIRNYNPDDHDK